MNEPDTVKVDAEPHFNPADYLHPNSRFVAFLTQFIGEENPVMLRAAIENVARQLAKQETKNERGEPAA